jgi:hypothetical protein
MASFSYTVDTMPMAEEMRSVSHHVDGTTTAVVAMQAAVIEAETIAADHICTNVNRGFYSLIRSQISQKIARLQSEVDSQLSQLKFQNLAVLAIRSRMERDYHMISARYLKLFNSLNKNLKSRVTALDRPAIDLAQNNVAKLNNRYLYLTTTVAVNQLESVSSSQRIISANIKKRAEAAILSLERFILEMNEQERLTSQILVKDQPFWAAGPVYLPIAVYETKSAENNQEDVEIEIPLGDFKNASASALKNAAFSSADLSWMPNVTGPEIKDQFHLLVASSGARKRIRETMIELFDRQKNVAL